jgi:hypothetical protein
MIFRRIVQTSVAVAAVAGVAVGTSASAHDSGKIKSDSMIGVPVALTGTPGNIRGINGAGLPWTIGDSDVSLKANGKVSVAFDDLVFAAGPNAGKNTLASMRVVVSCLDGANQVANVMTPTFPVSVANGADPGGDGAIETTVALPSPCLAPVVLITNAAGTGWFAVDGL